MENHIEVIRSAVAVDAPPEVRRAGALACRAVLAMLEPSTEVAHISASEPREMEPAQMVDLPTTSRSEASAVSAAPQTSPTAMSGAEPSEATSPASEPTPPATVPLEHVLGSVLAAFKGMPPGQFLSTAIELLRSKVPPSATGATPQTSNANTPAVPPLRFHLVPVTYLGGKK